MPRKTGRKSRTKRQRAQKRLFSIERGLFKAISAGVFLFGLLVMIYVGMRSEILLVVALAGVGIFLWTAIIIPADQFQDVGEYLVSGDAGKDLHDRLNSLIPGRGRR